MNIHDIAGFIREEAMSDPEFKRAIRYFTGALMIDIDGECVSFAFDDGVLLGQLGESPENPEILVAGTQGHWDNMLEPYPVPFYQCLQTTSIKYGMDLSNTATFYAYLPALNRLVSLLRTRNSLGKVVA